MAGPEKSMPADIKETDQERQEREIAEAQGQAPSGQRAYPSRFTLREWGDGSGRKI